MTISTTTSRTSYNGNGVTTIFSVPFRFFQNSDLVVQLVTVSTGASTTLTLTTHYTVSGADSEAGGSVTMLTPPAVGQRLVIRRVITATQEVDYSSGDSFPAETHERALDRLTMLTQQGEEANSRSLMFPSGDTASGELPTVATRASKLLGFNSSGDLVVSAPSSGSAEELALDLASTASGKGAELVAFKQSGTGAVDRTTSDKLREKVSIEDFGTAGDGGSCVSEINAAITYLNNAGGGVLTVPAGEYGVDGVITLKSRVIIVGQGPRATVFKRMAGYTGDMFKTLDFDTLVSGDTAGGPNRFGLHALTINGDYQNNPSASGWALRIYGRAYSIRDLEIEYCSNGGFYSKWGSSSAAWDDDSTDSRMEAVIDGLHIQFTKDTPVFDGPHDSQIDNLVIALPQHYQPFVSGSGNFIVGSRAGGTQFGKVHIWGDFAEWCLINYAGNVSFSDLLVDDARIGGGLIKQLSNNCFIQGRGLQFGSDNIKGVQIGQLGTGLTATNNRIILHLDRVPSTAVDFSLDGGNDVDVTVNAPSSTTNFAGTRHSTTTLVYRERGAGADSTDFYNVFGGVTLNSEGVILRPRSGIPISTWENGFIYYDSSTHKFRGYANGVWVDLH